MRIDLGAKIVSLHGEKSDGPSGEPCECPAGSVGEITVKHYYAAQGWTYGVEFPEGVFVFLTEAELADSACYTVPS